MTTNNEQPSWIEIRIKSWEELVEALHSLEIIPHYVEAGGHRRSTFFFRGMADESWKLMTSLERLGSPPEVVEMPALRAFQKYAPVGTFSPRSEWERLAVAQHNGLPTRVLDWTFSPLIAAHFATAESQYKDADGVVWCVNNDILRKYFLPDVMRAELMEAHAYGYNVPLLDKLYPSLGNFDKTDKIFGDAIIFIEPPSIDARIQNQYGFLSAMNGASKSHDAYLRQCSKVHPKFVYRIVIEHTAKAEIRDMLDQNNITERMLFPGLPGLCDWLRRYYGPV